jgi:hypothetical protein
MRRVEKSNLWPKYSKKVQLQLVDPNRSIADNVIAALEKAREDYRDSQWSYTRKNGDKVIFDDVVKDILHSISE